MQGIWPSTIAILTGGTPALASHWPSACRRVVHVSDREPEGWPRAPADWHPHDEPQGADGYDQVLEALSRGPVSVNDLAARLRIGYATATMRLCRLAERGLVRRVGRGVWRRA